MFQCGTLCSVTYRLSDDPGEKIALFLPLLLSCYFCGKHFYTMEQHANLTENVTQAVPFFMVANLQRSLDFYAGGLGFSLINQWIPRDHIEWCWLQLGGAALMLQEIRKNNSVKKYEDRIQGLGVSICFQCRDSLLLYHQFKEKKLNPAEPFVGNGLWVVIITDPDGYRLEFSSPTTVAEETRYSDYKASS